MLLICRNMFDIGDTYLVEAENFKLHGHTYAYDDLMIKMLAPGVDNQHHYDGRYIYLVSTDKQTFQIKKIYKEGDTYAI